MRDESLRIQYLSSDEVVSEARVLQVRWGSLTDPEKRRVTENITEKVVIGKDEVTIDLCYLPSSSERVAKGQRNPRGS